MDGFLGAVVYLFSGLYVDLAKKHLPNKNVSNAIIIFLTTLCSLISIGVIVCAVLGGLLINGYREDQILGIALLVLGAVLFLINMGIALYNTKDA